VVHPVRLPSARAPTSASVRFVLHATLLGSTACLEENAITIGRYEPGSTTSGLSADTTEDESTPTAETPTAGTGDTEPGAEGDTEPDTEGDTEPDTEGDTEPEPEGETEPGAEGATETDTEGATLEPVRDGTPCDTPEVCIASDPCLTTSCADQQCTYLLSDAACPSDQVCTLSGCLAPPPSCEEVYGDALIFCDDFDRGLDWNWTATDAVRLVVDAPNRASAVAHVRIATPSEGSTLQLQLPTPLDSGMVAIRSRIYVTPQTQPKEGVTLFAMTPLPATETPPLAVELFPDLGLAIVDRMIGETVSFSPAITLGTWHCIEWRVTIHDEEGINTLLLDGRPLVESRVIDTRPSGGVSQLSIGLRTGPSESDPSEIFFDDVVFSTAPIGCT